MKTQKILFSAFLMKDEIDYKYDKRKSIFLLQNENRYLYLSVKLITNGDVKMGANNLVVLIIDNEAQELLKIVNLLQSNPFISEILTASDTNEAILKIISKSPDVVLIDYPTKGNSEKELFELIKTKLQDSTLIFVSESKEFAKTAIQNGIYNYLLKPLNRKALDDQIKIALEKKHSNIKSRFDQLISNNVNEIRLRFLTTNGYIIFSPDELIFCKATGYYTELYLTNDRNEISHLSLLKIEEKMIPYGFLRIGRTHMINPKYIKRIFKKGNTITLSSDGIEYELKAGKDQLKKLSNFELD